MHYELKGLIRRNLLSLDLNTLYSIGKKLEEYNQVMKCKHNATEHLCILQAYAIMWIYANLSTDSHSSLISQLNKKYFFPKSSDCLHVFPVVLHGGGGGGGGR